MNSSDVRRLALELLSTHDLIQKGWTFAFFNGKNKIGLCYHSRRQIQFSKHYLMLRDDEIRDTLLHEIAHALAGPNEKHGPVWKKICLQIGATPSAIAYSLSAQPDSKWTGVCPNGHTLIRHALTEKSRRIACGRCCKDLNGGRYSSSFKFTWMLTEDYQASPAKVAEPVAAHTTKPGFEGLTIINL